MKSKIITLATMLFLCISVRAQIPDLFPGKWRMIYREDQGKLSVVFTNIFIFNADGTFSEDGTFRFNFKEDESGNCKIGLKASGKYAINGDKLTLYYSKEDTHTTLLEANMSKFLKAVALKPVMAGVESGFKKPRTSTILELGEDRLRLLSADKKDGKYVRFEY